MSIFSASQTGTVKPVNHNRLPPWLRQFLRPAERAPVAAPVPNPARDLALIGAAKRQADAREKRRAFHRAMREQLGLPPHPILEDQ